MADWVQDVRTAFPEEGLTNRILLAAEHGDRASLPQLFQEISRYVISLRAQSNSQDGHANAKKRKLEDDAPANNHVVPKPVRQSLGPAFFECKDVSVQIPARKKMKVEMARDMAVKGADQIRLVNPTTSELEYALPLESVEEAFCLPVPEKQARQMNFVVFPKLGTFDSMGRMAEQLLFVMNETPPVGVQIKGDTISEDDTYVTITHRALDQWLSTIDKRVITPTAAEFASSIVQSHRRNEKAYHVKAHRGSKEGYLFFLENGIVFGFKKPLAFYPFLSIESISYTSVLQRTFNLVIATIHDSIDAPVREVEFSMLDQEEFAGIDAYVKRHGLNDASMAAQRQAKAYNVNKEKKAEANGDAGVGVEEDGQTELQKAEQELQDEEDELEEDYEVSGGESEGEEDSEEEEEAYDDEVEEVEGEYEDEEADE